MMFVSIHCKLSLLSENKETTKENVFCMSGSLKTEIKIKIWFLPNTKNLIGLSPVEKRY